MTRGGIIKGELYIAGNNVGRGYINRPDLMIESFVSNPFNPNEIIYKTGDIAKWYPKGEVGIVGRTDNQVKINGYRIELDEIRCSIMEIKNIKDAAIVKSKKDNKEILIAYLVTKKRLSERYIKERLKAFLPNYMIPSYIVFTEELPLNVSGKIDYDKLPIPTTHKKKGKVIKPKDIVESEVLNIWKNELKKEIISVNESIHNIGGDSLSIINVASQIYKSFQIDIPINIFSEMDTVRKISEYIKNSKKEKHYINNQIVLIKKSTNNKNLFLIHAGNGEINNYQELCNYIDVNCWGLRAGTCGLHPQNITIQQIAHQYVDVIKNIQTSGIYNIAGWCVGGNIAFEIAKILEKRNEKVNFIGLFNSLLSTNDSKINAFSIKTEMDFFEELTGKRYSFDNIQTIEEYWSMLPLDEQDPQNIISKLPEDVKIIIPNLQSIETITLLRYINLIRTLYNAREMYKPGQTIDAQVYFFSALQDKHFIQETNLQNWNKFCKQKIIRHNIDSDHYSLFKKPYAGEIGKKIDTLINNEV